MFLTHNDFGLIEGQFYESLHTELIKVREETYF